MKAKTAEVGRKPCIDPTACSWRELGSFLGLEKGYIKQSFVIDFPNVRWTDTCMSNLRAGNQNSERLLLFHKRIFYRYSKRREPHAVPHLNQAPHKDFWYPLINISNKYRNHAFGIVIRLVFHHWRSVILFLNRPLILGKRSGSRWRRDSAKSWYMRRHWRSSAKGNRWRPRCGRGRSLRRHSEIVRHSRHRKRWTEWEILCSSIYLVGDWLNWRLRKIWRTVLQS